MRNSIPVTIMRIYSRHPHRLSAYDWTLCLLLFSQVAGVPLAHAGLPGHRQPKVQVQAILRLERKWQAAILQANTGVMASMLAEDYLGITPEGRLRTKAETLADYKDGTVHFDRVSTSEYKIRIYGSTAVVVSRAKVTGTSNGVDISGHYRYTRVYHYHSPGWKIVSFEASRIHKPQHEILKRSMHPTSFRRNTGKIWDGCSGRQEMLT